MYVKEHPKPESIKPFVEFYRTNSSLRKWKSVRTGHLSCHVASGWGFIFGSSRELRCAYARNPNYTEYYDGSITDFGADIGYLQSGVILWAIAAPTDDLGPGALAGHYGGATASAAIGVEQAPMFCSAASRTRLRCSQSRSRAKMV
jgi:hypothetical protein